MFEKFRYRFCVNKENLLGFVRNLENFYTILKNFLKEVHIRQFFMSEILIMCERNEHFTVFSCSLALTQNQIFRQEKL